MPVSAVEDSSLPGSGYIFSGIQPAQVSPKPASCTAVSAFFFFLFFVLSHPAGPALGPTRTTHDSAVCKKQRGVVYIRVLTPPGPLPVAIR